MITVCILILLIVLYHNTNNKKEATEEDNVVLWSLYAPEGGNCIHKPAHPLTHTPSKAKGRKILVYRKRYLSILPLFINRKLALEKEHLIR